MCDFPEGQQCSASQLFSILPPSITSKRLLSASNCPRPLWDSNMNSFILLLFWVWMLWREGTHQVLSRTQDGEWLIHQQEAYYLLTLTFSQKPIPVLCICLTFPSIQKSSHFLSDQKHNIFCFKGMLPPLPAIYLSILEYGSQGNN